MKMQNNPDLLVWRIIRIRMNDWDIRFNECEIIRHKHSVYFDPKKTLLWALIGHFITAFATGSLTIVEWVWQTDKKRREKVAIIEVHFPCAIYTHFQWWNIHVLIQHQTKLVETFGFNVCGREKVESIYLGHLMKEVENTHMYRVYVLCIVAI